MRKRDLVSPKALARLLDGDRSPSYTFIVYCFSPFQPPVDEIHMVFLRARLPSHVFLNFCKLSYPQPFLPDNANKVSEPQNEDLKNLN